MQHSMPNRAISGLTDSAPDLCDLQGPVCFCLKGAPGSILPKHAGLIGPLSPSCKDPYPTVASCPTANREALPGLFSVTSSGVWVGAGQRMLGEAFDEQMSRRNSRRSSPTLNLHSCRPSSPSRPCPWALHYSLCFAPGPVEAAVALSSD